MQISRITCAVAVALALAAGTAFAQADPVEATRNAEQAKADAATAEAAADVAEDIADEADRVDAPGADAAEKRADAAEDAAKAAANAAEDADESAEDVRDGDADAPQEAGRARAGADVAAAGKEVAVDAAVQNAAAPASPAATPEQQAMMDAWQKAGAVGAPHGALAHFVGDWNAKVTLWVDPAAPPQTSVGTESTTLKFGGRFVESKFNGTYAGAPFEGTSVMGYDNVRGKYTSTWHDSMSTGIFMSMGDYDAATRTYTLRGTMTDPMKPAELTPIRQVIRIVDANNHVFEWHETHAGQEAKTMQIEYTRK